MWNVAPFHHDMKLFSKTNSNNYFLSLYTLIIQTSIAELQPGTTSLGLTPIHKVLVFKHREVIIRKVLIKYKNTGV